MIIINDEFFDANLNTLNQLKARNANNIIITDCKSKINPKLFNKCIEVPSHGMLTALLCVIPL